MNLDELLGWALLAVAASVTVLFTAAILGEWLSGLWNFLGELSETHERRKRSTKGSRGHVR